MYFTQQTFAHVKVTVLKNVCHENGLIGKTDHSLLTVFDLFCSWKPLGNFILLSVKEKRELRKGEFTQITKTMG